MQASPRCLIVLAVLPAFGCTATRHSYSTTPEPEHRDTFTAQRLNEQGLKAVEDGKYERAEELFRDALDADIFYAPAHNNLGLALLHSGQAYEAAWEFQFAAKLMPNAVEPRNNLGLTMEKVGNLDKAIEYYDEALAIDPENVEVMGHLARAHVKTHDPPEDLREWLKRLAFQKPEGDWQTWARQTLVKLGRIERQDH